MGTQITVGNSLLGTVRTCSIGQNPRIFFQIQPVSFGLRILRNKCLIKCSGEANVTLRTCKNCKTHYDPSANHPRACRHHTAHFGGETRRKFESVYSGGTMNTPDGGKVSQYWHCCGSEDPFDPGCTAAPHLSYDD